jgi:hypothetical protein
MVAYLDKQRANAAENVTSTHRRVLKLIRKLEGVGHKLFMDNYFSTPQLFSDLSIYLSICLSVYGSTALLDLGRFFGFFIYTQ